MNRTRALSALALTLLVPAAGRAQTPWRYSHDVHMTYEFDDNVQEQLVDPTRAQVAKLGYHGQLLWNGGDQRLTFSYQGGVKQHFGGVRAPLDSSGLRGEVDIPSQFVNQGDIGYLRKVTPRLAVGGQVGLKHRAWMDGFFFLNEDGFRRASAGVNAVVDLVPVAPEQAAQLELGVEWNDSEYTNLDNLFGNSGAGGYARVVKQFGEDVEVGASYEFDRIRYPGRQNLEPGDNPLNILSPVGPRQEDDIHQLGAAARWFGPVSVVADYRFRYNDSNSFGFSYVSHTLGIQLLRPLPWRMLVQVLGQVELRSFLEPVPSVTAGSLDTDDSQNNVLLFRLVKDLTAGTSIEARYARYRNEAITLNEFYTKNIWAVGFAYRP